MAGKITYEFPEMRPDERLRELILYIALKCESDARFNATRLNKILFYADFVSFANTGKPVTGAAYKAIDRGPVPSRRVARADPDARHDSRRGRDQRVAPASGRLSCGQLARKRRT